MVTHELNKECGHITKHWQQQLGGGFREWCSTCGWQGPPKPDLQKEVERLRRELADTKWRERMWKKAAKSWMADADALKAKYEPQVLDICLETSPESGAESPRKDCCSDCQTPLTFYPESHLYICEGCGEAGMGDPSPTIPSS
jgi:hypothetical protein